MADTNESTKAKLKAVTSPIIPSRQTSLVSDSTSDGQKSVTSPSVKFQKEAEKMRDTLAIALDLLDQWSCRMPNGEMPKPHISSRYGVLMIALPMGGHVIENTVTSDGKHDFMVDGTAVMSVTSESEPHA